MIRVTVWDENLQETNSEMRKVYPQGIRGVLADALSRNPEYDVTAVHAQMADFGMPDELLKQTDVLIWWEHTTHDTLPDELAEKIQREVHRGMGLIVLHSAHLSKIFRGLMGTGCTLKYRYVDREKIWTTAPLHPIAAGVPEMFELDIEEMYGEYFDIPKPDDVVFTGWFESGHVFRAGCTWVRGRGKIFYFHVGHDTYPTYHNPHVQKIIGNAVLWAQPCGEKRESICVEV